MRDKETVSHFDFPKRQFFTDGPNHLKHVQILQTFTFQCFCFSDLMMGSPGLEHLGHDPKYASPECYSPKLFGPDHHRDYKGKHLL